MVVRFRARHISMIVCLSILGTACKGSGSSSESLDLVGNSTASVQNSTQPTPRVENEATRFFGVDLIQDWVFRKQRDKWSLMSPDAHVTVEKLKTADMGLVFSVLPQSSGMTSKKALLKAFDTLDSLIAETNGAIQKAESFKSAERIIQGGHIAVMASLEGADVFVKDLSFLSALRKRGLAMISLTGTHSNELAESALAPREIGGLYEKGRLFLKALRDLKILADVTYASKRTFWDVIEEQMGSVVVSHTAAAALMEHARNIDDLQILALKRYGGLVGLTFNPEFLITGEGASIDDVTAHLMHIKALGALSNCALGTDFDGIVPPAGLEDIASISKLRDALIRQGVTESEVDGVFGTNAARFLKSALGEFGATERTLDEILRPLATDCDFVSGPFEGKPGSSCNGYVRDGGTLLTPSSRHRFRMLEVSSSPVTLEIFGDPNDLWQVEAQNLSGKILFHHIVQLDDRGMGTLSLTTATGLTRLFLNPTRATALKEAVIWGRPPFKGSK